MNPAEPGSAGTRQWPGHGGGRRSDHTLPGGRTRTARPKWRRRTPRTGPPLRTGSRLSRAEPARPVGGPRARAAARPTVRGAGPAAAPRHPDAVGPRLEHGIPL